MGALVRGRNANRLAAIASMIEGVDKDKLAEVISGYDEGAVAVDADGEPICDEEGEELGMLDVAISKLSADEKEKLKAFVMSIYDETNPRAKEMADLVISADELPDLWEQPDSPHEILQDLLRDVLSDLYHTL